MTIGEAMARWAEALAAAGCPEAEREALLIAAHVLGDEPGRAAARRREEMGAEAFARGEAIVARRRQREPLQYILGEAWFYGLRFACDERALIPRPETEALVDAVLEAVGPNAAPLIVDVGTGCGCIAIAIAVRRPGATLVATDISRDALELAAENAQAHGVKDRVRLVHGDLLRPVIDSDLVGLVEIVVANLPYVAEDEWESLAPEVRREPREALVAGPTGAELYERLAEQLAPLPRLRWFAVELSATRGDLIRQAFDGRGFELETRRDLAGHERVLIGRRALGNQ